MMGTLAAFMLAVFVLALAFVGAGTIYLAWRIWSSMQR